MNQKVRRIGLIFFACSIENHQPKENVRLKIDFENALNLINRQIILDKTFATHAEIYKYSHSAYSQPSFFYGDSLIIPCEGSQQGYSEKKFPLYFEIPFRIRLTVWSTK